MGVGRLFTLNGGSLLGLRSAEWRRLGETKIVGVTRGNESRGTSNSWSSYSTKVVACNASSKLRDNATKTKHVV